MKIAIVTVCILTLFSGVTASSFSNGMTTGFITSNVIRKVGFKAKSKKLYNFTKYNNFTRDTSLQKFPIVSLTQCIPEKKRIISPPLTFGQRIFTTIIVFFILTSFMHLLLFAPDKDREWFIGYIMGKMIEEILNDD